LALAVVALMTRACVSAWLAALAGSEAAARTRKLRRLIAVMTYRFNVCPFVHRRDLERGYYPQCG
jgi:hypothetical protein